MTESAHPAVVAGPQAATSPDDSAAQGPLTPGDPRLGPWRAFLVAHARVSRRLDEDLRTEQALTLAEYSALVQIAESPGRRLRMNQLAEGILLSRSGVTRLIDRLEADGLVTRSGCQSDGRGAEAVLTIAGLERVRAASKTHLRGIAEYFLAAVEPGQLDAIGRTLAAVGERNRREPSVANGPACDEEIEPIDRTGLAVARADLPGNR